MTRSSWRVHAGRSRPSRRLGIWLARAGTLYMTASLGRIGVGLLAPDAPGWFREWIPASFHIVLAGFVLAASFHHLRETTSPP